VPERAIGFAFDPVVDTLGLVGKLSLPVMGSMTLIFFSPYSERKSENDTEDTGD